MNDLPDIQCSEPAVKKAIQQVGVQNIELPFILDSRDGGARQMVADVSMRTNLDENTKGISMSRLLLTLKKYLDVPLKQKLIAEILREIRENVGSTESFIRFDFRMPRIKHSILSENSFPIFYKCGFEGQMLMRTTHRSPTNPVEIFRFFQRVQIQYASYCPCSAELSKDLRSKGKDGFPHAQRSYADITAEIKPYSILWLEDIIDNVEDKIPTLPYPIIKRVDEQELARVASEYPIFVEDAARMIADGLDNNCDIIDWALKCTHEESIHTSEAIAMMYKGIIGGLGSRYFI